MKSNSLVIEAGGCKNLRLSKTAKTGALRITDAITTQLQHPAVADKVHCMLYWILVQTDNLTGLTQTLQVLAMVK